MIVQRRAVVEKQANPSYGCRRDDQNVARSENISSDHKRYVSFYFTNFPVQLSHFYLRKGFEVCGILEDVYVARKRNKRGQPYGFVRFSNVRDIPKLTKALNAVSFGDFRVWARVARFDRNVVPLDETVGADVDKVKGGVVSVGAKPQEQIANEANRKLRVDEQPKKDTFAHPSGVSVPREGVTVGTVLVSLGGRWERADGVSAQK
jgi:hypothetical protein